MPFAYTSISLLPHRENGSYGKEISPSGLIYIRSRIFCRPPRRGRPEIVAGYGKWCTWRWFVLNHFGSFGICCFQQIRCVFGHSSAVECIFSVLQGLSWSRSVSVKKFGLEGAFQKFHCQRTLRGESDIQIRYPHGGPRPERGETIIWSSEGSIVPRIPSTSLFCLKEQ